MVKNFDFVKLLAELLREQDRSASWLAKQLDLSPSTVSKWLSGDTRPGSPEIVLRIADIFHIKDEEVRLQLLRDAGYDYVDAGSVSPKYLPTEEEIEQICERCQSSLLRLEGKGFPAYLLDCRDRIILWNRCISTLFDSIGKPDLLAKMKNQSLAVALLDPAFDFASVLHNYAAYLEPGLWIMLQGGQRYREESWYQAYLEEMQQRYPLAKEVFASFKSADAEVIKQRPFVPLEIAIESLGVACFDLHSVPTPISDDRFRIVYWTAANDAATQFIKACASMDF